MWGYQKPDPVPSLHRMQSPVCEPEEADKQKATNTKNCSVLGGHKEPVAVSLSLHVDTFVCLPTGLSSLWDDTCHCAMAGAWDCVQGPECTWPFPDSKHRYIYSSLDRGLHFFILLSSSQTAQICSPSGTLSTPSPASCQSPSLDNSIA